MLNINIPNEGEVVVEAEGDLLHITMDILYAVRDVANGIETRIPGARSKMYKAICTVLTDTRSPMYVSAPENSICYIKISDG